MVLLNFELELKKHVFYDYSIVQGMYKLPVLLGKLH
jgi:hypothetical protein